MAECPVYMYPKAPEQLLQWLFEKELLVETCRNLASKVVLKQFFTCYFSMHVESSGEVSVEFPLLLLFSPYKITNCKRCIFV